MNPLDFLLGKTKPSPRGSVPGFPPAPRGRFPSSWGVPKVPVSAVPKGGAGTLLFNPITAAYSIPGYSEQKTRNAAGVIEGTRGPLNELQYIGGELLRGRMPYSKPYKGIKPEYGGPNAAYYGPAYASAQALGLDGSTPSLRNYGPGYKEKELATGAAAERFRPGAGFPGQQGAADRAYQQELSRTAQLTAQDPELLRYEAARSAAKTQEEMNSVRDMGLAMWQERYGKTAMGKPGGAIGSFNPLMQRTFGYQTGMSPSDIAQTITNPAAIPVGPGEAPYQMGDLGTGALAETGYDPTRYGVDVEEIKKRLLQQAAAK
jgi:hypothetical protein